MSSDRNRTVTTFERTAAPEPEAPAGAAEPIPENGSGDGRRPDGRFAAGNQVARQHGVYASQQSAELAAEVDAFLAGLLSDLGGESELSTVELAYVARLCRLELTLRLLETDIAASGLVTPAGGVRRIYEHYLHGLDRFDRLAQRLGMRRRARPVESAADIIREYAERRQQQESSS